MSRLGLRFLLGFGLFALLACSSDPPAHNYHSATYVNDTFAVDNMTVGEKSKNQNFFLKHCEVTGNHPQFNNSEYHCNDMR